MHNKHTYCCILATQKHLLLVLAQIYTTCTPLAICINDGILIYVLPIFASICPFFICCYFVSGINLVTIIEFSDVIYQLFMSKYKQWRENRRKISPDSKWAMVQQAVHGNKKL